MNEIPHILPDNNSELNYINWEFPFGNALCQDALDSALRFIYTECETFTKAIDPRYRIILGRKGVGKTSLIKRIRLGDEYDIKIVCNKDELFKWVNTSMSNGASNNNYIEEYQRKCIEYYWIIIFEKIIKEYPNSHKIRSIKRYLDRSSLISKTQVISGLRDWADAGLKSSHIIISVLAGLIKIFTGQHQPDFDSAKKEAEKCINGKSIVILIDNLESYLLDDPREHKALSGLLLSSVAFRGEQNNITVKCFIPSEYYTLLKKHAANWGKLNQHITTLRWKDRELLSMLCKRLGFYLYLNNHLDRPDLAQFDKVDNALFFWKKYFASSVYNLAFEVNEPVVVYILRHTQLTPRQAIQLCNKIVEISSSFPNSIILEKEVRDGVQKWEKELCTEVFSSFQQIYPFSEGFCTQYLRRLPMCFRFPMLKSRVFDTIDIDSKKHSTYQGDYISLERMLFEMGVIGEGTNLENSPTSAIYQLYNLAKFEPHFDDTLNPNEYTDIFVHPMFIHKINFIRDPDACSKPVCPIQVLETPEMLNLR